MACVSVPNRPRSRLAAVVLAAVIAGVGLQAAEGPSSALSPCSTESCATLTVTIPGDPGASGPANSGDPPWLPIIAVLALALVAAGVGAVRLGTRRQRT